MIKLYHYTLKENLEKILSEGLKPTSHYEEFTDLRRGVVFCWLSPDDQKIFNDNMVCLEIEVEEDRCTVAEMDFISFAMMYKYGGANFGGKNLPINPDASDLFVKLYEVTATKIDNCEKNSFFTPEVLVKGEIRANHIKILN